MAVTLNANSSTGFIATSDTSGVLQLQTGGTTAVTVDASQNVGIGTASPTDRLDIRFASGTGNLKAGVTAGNNIKIYNSAGDLSITTSDSASDAILDSQRSVIFKTANTERMRINAGAPILCLAGGSTTATGTGIAFPATQSASSDANTLDDYEEGTWTPTYLGSTTNPTITYGQQVGRYVKIGRLVYVEANIATTSASGGSGVLNLGGLPFTTDSACTDIGISIGITAFWGTAPTQGGFQLSSVVIALFSGGNTNLSVSALSNAGGANYLRFQASYRASA